MATIEMQVTIPQGFAPGMQMPVQGPTGVVMVVVPPGAFPGTTIAFAVPVQQTQQTQQTQRMQQMVQLQMQMQQQQQQRPIQQQPGQSTQGSSSGYGSGSSSGGQELGSTTYLNSQRKWSPQHDGTLSFCCICTERSIDKDAGGFNTCCAFYCCTSTPGCTEFCPCHTKRLVVIGQDEVGIVERYQKFYRVAAAGPYFLGQCLCIKYDSLERRLSLRMQQFVDRTQTKTKDNTFCEVEIAVQYKIDPGMAKEAYYSLEDFDRHVSALVSDVVRNKLAKLELDEALEAKEALQNDIMDKLRENLQQFGFVVASALVTGLEPAKTVKEEMNNIYASKMEKHATEELAQAEKIVSIKRSEGEAERKALLGVGTARQRGAIASGLEATLGGFADGISTDRWSFSRSDALYVQLFMNYLDFQTALSKAATIPPNLFLPTEIGAVDAIRSSISHLGNSK